MSDPTVCHCGGPKGADSKQCRRCHLASVDLRRGRPRQIGPTRVPEKLYTGAELLDRIWWRRQRTAG